MNTSKVIDFDKIKLQFFKQTLRPTASRSTVDTSDPIRKIQYKPYPKEPEAIAPLPKPRTRKEITKKIPSSENFSLTEPDREIRLSTQNITQEAFGNLRGSQDNLYELLDIFSSAEEKDIAKAYKRMCVQYYPDRRRGSEKDFLKISEAYKILSNPELRKLYDQQGYQAALYYLQSSTLSQKVNT